jgi:hypothetical protein
MTQEAHPPRKENFTADELKYYENRVLGAFPGRKVEKSAAAHDVQCPDPDCLHSNGDATPSLGIDLKRNGSGVYTVLHCRSQKCNTERVLREVGLGFGDLYFSAESGAGSKVLLPGCTLKEYAAYKSLPVEFLEGDEVGLEDDTYFCPVRGTEVPAVLMPYADEGGRELTECRRWRTGLYKTSGNDIRIRSRSKKSGGRLTLYGRWRLEEAEKAGYVLLVEGESDCHTSWYYGLPAIGIPGAQNWRDEWAGYLKDIGKIIVMMEPDQAGAALWKKVSSCKALRGRVRKGGMS